MRNLGGSGGRPLRTGRLRRGGFTLIELMVVIAIISILIAITIPVYRAAREKTIQTYCMANLYQIATALRIYRVDEGVYPGPYDPVTGEGGLNQLYPYYLDNRRALICLDDPIQSGDDYYRQYQALLDSAGQMYDGGCNWRDPAFFSEHYSSYNALYNYMGYVQIPQRYSLCDYRYAGQEMGIGDSVAYWYEWFRWDPGGNLDYRNYPDRFYVVDAFLHYDLAQQVYWAGYRDDPLNTEEDPTRLVDNLGRPLWDMGDAPWAPGVEGWYPYGIYSSVFPGLINRNAPENTIVTRCPWHREWTVVRLPRQPPAGTPEDHRGRGDISPRRTAYQQDETPRDIVLRLDGSCSLVRGFGYDWAKQPR